MMTECSQLLLRLQPHRCALGGAEVKFRSSLCGVCLEVLKRLLLFCRRADYETLGKNRVREIKKRDSRGDQKFDEVSCLSSLLRC